MKEKDENPLTLENVTADKLIVQKSRPLLSLCFSKYTLQEFKILDIYLGRIDSHKPEKNTVVIGRGELERLMGGAEINITSLKRWLNGLMQSVELTVDSQSDEVDIINIFARAKAQKDEHGQWQITLRCTDDAMKYIFNVENFGYLRYCVDCVKSFTSVYTYLLFTYLKDNFSYHTSWDISLDDMKKILRCDGIKTYKKYGYFNDAVLMKAKEELIEKTGIRFTHTAIKHGRTVIGLHFEIESIPLVGQATEVVCKDIKEALKPLEFTVEQYDELWNLLLKIPLETLKNTKLTREEETQKDVIRYNGTAKRRLDRTLQKIKQKEEGAMKTLTIEFMYADDEEKMKKELLALYRSSYLKRIAEKVVRIDARKPITNKFAYLRKIIQEDVGTQPEA